MGIRISCMDRTGIRRSVILYFILAFIVLVSMRFFEYSAAVVAYCLIILITYALIKRHVEFRWGNSMQSGFSFWTYTDFRNICHRMEFGMVSA